MLAAVTPAQVLWAVGLLLQLVGLALIVIDFLNARAAAKPPPPEPQVVNVEAARLVMRAGEATLTTSVELTIEERLAAVEQGVEALKAETRAVRTDATKAASKALSEATRRAYEAVDALDKRTGPLLRILGRPHLSLLGTVLVAVGLVVSVVGDFVA